MKKCPYCAEEILEEAIKCRYCFEMLDAKTSPEDTIPIPSEDESERSYYTNEKIRKLKEENVEPRIVPSFVETKSEPSPVMKKCPYCAEEILEEAIKCRYCNEMLNDIKKTIPEQSKLSSFFAPRKEHSSIEKKPPPPQKKSDMLMRKKQPIKWIIYVVLCLLIYAISYSIFKGALQQVPKILGQ